MKNLEANQLELIRLENISAPLATRSASPVNSDDWKGFTTGDVQLIVIGFWLAIRQHDRPSIRLHNPFQIDDATRTLGVGIGHESKDRPRSFERAERIAAGSGGLHILRGAGPGEIVVDCPCPASSGCRFSGRPSTLLGSVFRV